MKIPAITLFSSSNNIVQNSLQQTSKAPNNLKDSKLAPLAMDTVSFGYKSPLKTHWLKGEMPQVEYGVYGGKLTKKNVTLEHLQPHSKGGKTNLNNLALAVNVNNWERSSKPFSQYHDEEAFRNYCDQFKDVHFDDFDGLEYIEGITKTAERLLKEGK